MCVRLAEVKPHNAGLWAFGDPSKHGSIDQLA